MIILGYIMHLSHASKEGDTTTRKKKEKIFTVYF